ncbi:MAG: DUF86 domain-containing protein [Phycisphaeraceae bacterium]|nr:DUF86 domain-containing protein [Phycisphaeraceae bacterium]
MRSFALARGVVILSDEFRAAHPSVPWKEARHFRNFMIHVYMAVDPLRLYETARNDLPLLKRALGDLLNTNLEPSIPPARLLIRSCFAISLWSPSWPTSPNRNSSSSSSPSSSPRWPSA